MITVKPSPENWIPKMWALVFLVLTAIAATTASAQQAGVYIDATSEDVVGKQLVFELREVIRRSASMTLADREQDARFILRLVTLDPDDGANARAMTVYSAVITMNTLHDTPIEMYLTNRVGTCGSRRTDSCAKRLAAALDEQAIAFRRLLRDALDQQQGRQR